MAPAPQLQFYQCLDCNCRLAADAKFCVRCGMVWPETSDYGPMPVGHDSPRHIKYLSIDRATVLHRLLQLDFRGAEHIGGSGSGLLDADNTDDAPIDMIMDTDQKADRDKQTT